MGSSTKGEEQGRVGIPHGPVTGVVYVRIRAWLDPWLRTGTYLK